MTKILVSVSKIIIFYFFWLIIYIALASIFVGNIFSYINPLVSAVIVVICASLFKYIFTRTWKFNYKRSLVLIILGILIGELFMIIAFPFESLIPAPILFKIGVVEDAYKSTCYMDIKLESAKNFFSTTVDFKDVRFVYGGLPRVGYFMEKWKIPTSGLARGGMTFGNSVYLASSESCLDFATVIHEIVHIWQYQHKPIVYLRGFKDYIHWQYFQFKEPSRLYDYGGESALIQAKNNEKKFTDFGEEQQATIVEEYIRNYNGFTNDMNGGEFTIKHVELLKYYTSQIF